MSIEDEILNRKTTAERWDTQDKDWEPTLGKRDPIPEPQFEDFYQKHRGQFRDALDIGCGTGKFLIPMVQDGLNVIGVELSEKRGGAAVRNLKTMGLEGKARIIKGISNDLSFLEDESVDYIFAKGSIHHNTWEGVQQSFREAVRVLRRGGVFMFQGRSTKDEALKHSEVIPDTGSTAKELTGWKKGMTQHYFNEDELQRLATENGLEIVLGPKERGREGGKARWWAVYRKI